MGLAKNNNNDFIKSNCHGFTLYTLGFGDNPKIPKFTPHHVMDSFLTDNCYRSQEHNGIIVGFREGDDTLGHTGIIIPQNKGPLIFHQPDFGLPLELTTLESYLNKNKSLVKESELEYYKYFPENSNLSYSR